MKRFLVFSLVFFALSVFAGETFRIALKDGRIIKSDTKPDIKGDRVYFEMHGVMLYLPVDRIDVKKTENGDQALSSTETPVKKKAAKKVVISEDELNEIKKRSRLANEDEIRALEYSPTAEGGEPGSGGDQGGPKASASQNLQGKLNNLMDQRSATQSQVNDLMSELASKKDQHGFATQATDKDRLENDIRDTESRLNDARNKLSSLDNSITATQQEIASTPVIIETGPGAQPAPSAPAQEQPQE